MNAYLSIRLSSYCFFDLAQKYGRNSHYSICAEPDAFKVTPVELCGKNGVHRMLTIEFRILHFTKYLTAPVNYTN